MLPLIIGACLVVVPAAPAGAARTSGWASWTPIATGENGYSSRVQLPGLGFPAATMQTDSQAPVLAGGTSTFIGGAQNTRPTPPGVSYGSSRGNAYLTLGTRSSGPTGKPSTTTYAFDRPTPAAGWTFVLGDIDADQVHVQAKNASGEDVPVAEIDGWFKGGFNYAGAAALPRWDAASATLLGAAGFADTVGSSGWFEPDQPLSSLTLIFTARAGFPSYQTWFAAAAHTLSGTVTGAATGGGDCLLTDATLTLLGADGTELAQRHPDATGAYSFGQLAEAGYLVRLDPPPNCTVTSPTEQPIDTTAGDAVAEFEVRRIEGLQVSGTVTAAGQPVAGITITLTPIGGGVVRVTTTADDGTYVIDALSSGTYTAVISGLPDGYVPAGPTSRTVIIAPLNNSLGQDFALIELPPVSGTVTGGGGPLGAVTITLTPRGGGASATTVTAGDGTYTFDHVSPGSYTVSIETPPGYRPSPPRTGILVATTAVTGQNFNLIRPAALGGSVTDLAGTPIADVTLTLTGPAIGTLAVSTTSDGRFHVEGLDPGSYTVTTMPPAGYRTVGDAAVFVALIDGQLDDTLHFILQSTRAVSPIPSQPAAPTTAPRANVPTTGQPGALAATGNPTRAAALTAAVLLGAGLLLLTATRRRTSYK